MWFACLCIRSKGVKYETWWKDEKIIFHCFPILHGFSIVFTLNPGSFMQIFMKIMSFFSVFYFRIFFYIFESTYYASGQRVWDNDRVFPYPSLNKTYFINSVSFAVCLGQRGLRLSRMRAQAQGFRSSPSIEPVKQNNAISLCLS